MNSVLFTLFSLLVASAFATDFTTSPSGYTIQDSTSSTLQLGITAGTTQLTSVTFTVVVSSPSISVTYPGGGSYANVGTIQASATGYGYFTVLGSEGMYYMNATISYKKSGISYKSIVNISLTIQGSGGGGGGRDFSIDEEVYVSMDERQLSLLPPVCTVLPLLGWEIIENVQTWVALEVTCDQTVTNITYVATPALGSAVYVGYAAQGGNTYSQFTAGVTAYPSFELIAPSAIPSVLTLSIKYWKGGVRYTTPAVKVLTVDSSKREVSNVETVARVAAGEAVEVNTLAPSSFMGILAGVAIGCIAVVASAAVVAALIVVKRQTQVSV